MPELMCPFEFEFRSWSHPDACREKSEGEPILRLGTKELLKQVDTNGDGEIDFQEFMEMMRS